MCGHRRSQVFMQRSGSNTETPLKSFYRSETRMLAHRCETQPSAKSNACLVIGRVILPGVGVAVSPGGRRGLDFVRRCSRGRLQLRPRLCFRGVPEELRWGRLMSGHLVLCRERLRSGEDRGVLLVELGIGLRIHWLRDCWFTIRLSVRLGLRRLSYLGIHSLGGKQGNFIS